MTSSSQPEIARGIYESVGGIAASFSATEAGTSGSTSPNSFIESGTEYSHTAFTILN